MRWYSDHGTGMRLYDIRRTDDGRIQFTVWLSAFWIPVIPISSWSAAEGRQNDVADEILGGYYFIDLVRIPHDWNRLAQTFCWGLFWAIVAVGPAIFMIALIQNRARNNVDMVLIIASFLWTMALIVVAENRTEKKLKPVQPEPAADESKPVSWQVLLGLLLFFVAVTGLALEQVVPNPIFFRLPFLNALILVIVGGAVGGMLMVPSCRFAGFAGGLVASLLGFFAVSYYVQWNQLGKEIVLIEAVATLPGVATGAMLRWILVKRSNKCNKKN